MENCCSCVKHQGNVHRLMELCQKDKETLTLKKKKKPVQKLGRVQLTFWIKRKRKAKIKKQTNIELAK